MNIPLVDLKAQYQSIKDEIQQAVNGILDNTTFIMGEDVTLFEKEFAGYAGTKHFVGLNSGTDALYLALRAAGITEGDEVITVANTFFATAEAIDMTGAKPVFVDVTADTHTIDVDKAVAAITPRTKAIIPVHLYGHPAPMVELMKLAEAFKVTVIEDCAQSHGATIDGKRAGTFGIAGCYSFFPGKNLGAYGDAGGMATNDDALDRQVRMLRNHGRADKYLHEFEGVSSRLDTLQAAILRVKLYHLEAWTEARIACAGRYAKLLAGIDGLELPVCKPGCRHVYHLYVVRVRNRDRVASRLKEKGIATGVHYPVPLHLQPAYRHLCYSAGAFPVVEKAAAEILSLPIYPELTAQQQEYIAENLIAALKEE